MKRFTEKAVIITKGNDFTDPPEREYMIPMSLIDEEDLAELEEGEQADTLSVEQWFAERECIE